MPFHARLLSLRHACAPMILPKFREILVINPKIYVDFKQNKKSGGGYMPLWTQPTSLMEQRKDTYTSTLNNTVIPNRVLYAFGRDEWTTASA